MPQTVLGEMTYAKQTGGRGHYGYVRLRVILDDGVEGVVFKNVLAADAIPARFFPAIESGIRTCIKAGMLEEYGYKDARIELYDASYHDVDSTDLAFFMASSMALQDALRRLPRADERGEDGPRVVVPRPSTPIRPHDAAAVAEPEDPEPTR
jgi:elongation factor G